LFDNLLYWSAVAQLLQSAKRPTGVTIVAILNIISGIIMLIGGIALVAIGSVLPGALPDTGISGLPEGAFGALGVGMGGIILALGIFSFVVAYGLLKGMGWAWTLTVVLSVISIALNAISIVSGNAGGIISIIISGVILYYLYRPHVKAYFGKGVKASTQP
jgi:hypothetical protein